MNSVVVLARQQLAGQGILFKNSSKTNKVLFYFHSGNHKNEWLSQKGCCMFTLYLNLTTDTFASSRLCLLQFAAALSCVQAILKSQDCQVVLKYLIFI